MTSSAKKIEREIRELPLEDMLALHESLIASIQEKEDSKGLDQNFRHELERRIAEIDSGKVTGVDAFRALREM